MNTQESETISFDPTDPTSLGNAFQKLADHIGALHKDVGLLSIVIGILVNAGDAGYLAQPNATREILTAVIDQYESEAPLSAMQLRGALSAPIGSPPPNSRKRLTIVQGEKKAA